MQSLFGEKLITKNGECEAFKALQGKTVGIYFSAHWCGPCRGFTPKLAESYKKMTASGKPFEIVFVSSDRDQKAFDEYYAEMPWMALPFENRDLKNKLSKKFKVSGIPSLVIVDENGATITTDGRSEISDDPTGANFPWAPKPFKELLGEEFLRNDGETVAIDELEGKVLAIYFSAHWCPPCKAFTPELVKTYNKLQEAGKPFEIIFASSDRDMKSFQEYFSEMPWLAIPQGDSRKTALAKKFGCSGIPMLVIVDADGNTITTNGRGAVGSDPDGANFPWTPKPVNDLSGGPDGLNEETCVLVMMEGVESSKQKEVEAVLEKLAVEVKGEDKMLFFTGKSRGGITDQIRKLCSLGQAGSSPKLLILDIPDDGGYYEAEGDVTEESIAAFLKAYKAGTLSRLELS